jgi:hypothetical protein
MNKSFHKRQTNFVVIIIGGVIMSVLDNFEQWKDFLGDRLHQATSQGMNQQVVSDIAYQVGDYLAKQVEPKNAQEKVLADLWSVATPEEQHAIANMMVKLVQNDGTMQ